MSPVCACCCPLRFFLPGAVVVVHGEGKAAEGVGADGVAGLGDALAQQRLLVGQETAQYVIDLAAAGEVASDAEAQALELLGAEDLGNVLEAVVAAVGSALADADGAEGQGDIVAEDKHALEGDVLLFHPITDGIARKIHVSGGLQQDEFLVLAAHAGYETVAAVLKNDIGRTLCECIQYPESDVVTGTIVLLSDVAQPYNQVLHLVRWFLVAKEVAQELEHYSAAALEAAERAERVIFT